MTNFSDNDKKEILNLKVTQMKDLLSTGKISNEELVNIHIDQVEKYDSRTNAICTFTPEQAVSEARKLDSNKKFDKPLSGIPIFIKDLTKTKGIRTTMGSRIYENYIPEEDDLVVEKIKNSGSIILGKSNTPEFGAGSQTFNDIFGTTSNPYDLTKTCGGSSGGAGTALAMRMSPLCQGSDMGGSLRNPAAWNNVVGFRTSIGRVPQLPSDITYNNYSVNGPMARNIDDLTLLLSVMAGYDNRIGICGSSGADSWWSSNWNPTDGSRDSANYATNYIRHNVSTGYLSFGAGGVDASATEKLRITSDKVMTSVDFKPDAHHQRDIGTAANAFKDIYSETITTTSVYDSRGSVRRIGPVSPVGVYDVVPGVGGTTGRFVFTTYDVRLVGGMTSGDVITIINNGGSDITIDAATNSVTLTNSADASTGDRTLASKGMATVLYVGSATAFISGAGLS